MPESEVAKLRQQIEEETESFRNALCGLAQVGGHAALTIREHILDRFYENIAELVGDRAASEIVTDEYTKVLEENPKRTVKIRLIYRHRLVLPTRVGEVKQ